MSDASIVYFPVGNGDTGLIKLDDGTTIMIDSNITKDALDKENDEKYDVYTFILGEFRKDNDGISHLDTFVLTHADDDHCRGIDEVFYLGDPEKYSQNDKKNGLIFIDELWFTPRLFLSEDGKKSECAKCLKKEAERRMKLYKNEDDNRALAGNRLRIIGYTENETLKGLEDIVTVPGHTLSLINGEKKKKFRFFVYAPLKKNTDNEECERNDSSLVLQARFDVDGETDACIVFFGGDAGCGIWEEIIDKNGENNLQWDLFLAPHHCSWGFFSDEPSDKDPDPSEKVLSLLDMGRQGAWVIVSSKPIKRNDDNPPHYKAANLYKKAVGKERFLCTGEHPDEKSPKPIVFKMSKNGPVKDEISDDGSAAKSAIKSVLGTPKTYGY